MLFCCLCTCMVLFYMVNWRDDDIRRYSWQIINSTISIFVSVLIFSGVDDYVTSLIPMDSHRFGIGLSYVIFFLFFVALQVIIMWLSGANCEGPDGQEQMDKEVWCCADNLRANFMEEVEERFVREKDAIGKKSVAAIPGENDAPDKEMFVEKTLKYRTEREQRVKAWATLFEHMTGFAAINMGGYLMNLEWFRQNPGTALLAAVVNQIFLLIVFRAAQKFRRLMMAMEGDLDFRDELYGEEVYEAENNISSLAGSFQITQVMRFAISAQLPEIDGEEEHESLRTPAQILLLYAGGLIIGSGALVILLKHDRIVKTLHYIPSIHRQLEMIQSCCAKVAAWTFFSATRWWLSSSCSLGKCDIVVDGKVHDGDDGGADTMAAHVIIALSLSAFACLLIRGLDCLEDWGKNHSDQVDSDTVSKAVSVAITALGILVGFSWERSFDHGVSSISTLTRDPELSKFISAFIVAIVIVPAWSMYIVSKVIAHRKWHKAVMNSDFHGFDRLKAGNTFRVEEEGMAM